MNLHRHTWMGVLVAALVAVSGCATAPASPDDPQIDGARSTDDRIQNATSMLRTLREHPEAEKAGPELDRVQVWLDRCERLRGDPDADQELLALTLEAIDGQLVQVRAFYARRDAERELEQDRVRYEADMKKIEALRQQNDAILNAQDSP